MKIVILDSAIINPGDLSWKGFEDLGDLVLYDEMPNDEIEIQNRIYDADIVLTNNTVLSRETILKSPNLKYIGVLSTGYNVIDIKAAKDKGISVTNIPEYGTYAVSQFAIALLLEICHNIGHHNKIVHDGKWGINNNWSFWEHPLIELYGKTIGIIGYGRIGKTTAAIAKAFGMHVIAYSPSKHSGNIDDICEFIDIEELMEKSDVISLHCPLTESTRGIINKFTINKMKDGVIIINVSRGGLIIEKDLAEALDTGKVYAAGVDVVSKEPIEVNNPLLNTKNCFITPHIAWAPKESRKRIIDMAINNLKSFLDGEPINMINY